MIEQVLRSYWTFSVVCHVISSSISGFQWISAVQEALNDEALHGQLNHIERGYGAD
jgi:hypothetical protein